MKVKNMRLERGVWEIEILVGIGPFAKTHFVYGKVGDEGFVSDTIDLDIDQSQKIIRKVNHHYLAEELLRKFKGA